MYEEQFPSRYCYFLCCFLCYIFRFIYFDLYFSIYIFRCCIFRWFNIRCYWPCLSLRFGHFQFSFEKKSIQQFVNIAKCRKSCKTPPIVFYFLPSFLLLFFVCFLFFHFCYCLLRTMIEEKSGLSVLPKSRFKVLIIIIFRRKFISLIDKTLYSRLNSKRMRNNGGAIPRRKTFDWVVGQMENFLVDVESWRLFQKNMFWIIWIIGWLLREYHKDNLHNLFCMKHYVLLFYNQYVFQSLWINRITAYLDTLHSSLQIIINHIV